MLELFLKPETWISLLTLTAMEIVLGIDNIIFISIITGKLPATRQKQARRLGIFLALFVRILLLIFISIIVSWTSPVFLNFSPRDLILLAGGLFLLVKSTLEIHGSLEGEESHKESKKKSSFGNIVLQIILIDIVFSFDSIITAVGLVKDVEIMIIAVIISMFVMLAFSGAISNFIHKHPTMKILALSFLLMIGLMLIVEAFHIEVPKGYVYFAMAFSVLVELLNMRLRKKSKPVKLRDHFEEGSGNQ